MTLRVNSGKLETILNHPAVLCTLVLLVDHVIPRDHFKTIINLCVARDQATYQVITRNDTESEFRQTGDDSKPPSSPMYFSIIGRSRDPSWPLQVWPDLQEGVLYTHHFNAQILPSHDSYTNVLAMHVCIIANSSSVCFSQGCFLRHVRRPRVLGWSLIGSAGC